MPNTEDLPEDWERNDGVRRARRRYLAYRAEDNFAEYLEQSSPQDRARAMWEQS